MKGLKIWLVLAVFNCFGAYAQIPSDNVSPKDVAKFKASGFVHYSDFGVRGDGKTDAIDAIAATHAFANQHGLSVKANEGATYYISGKNRTAVVQTDTDFGEIDISLPGTCIVTVTNSNVRRYIRFGPNQNNGSPQTNIFIVDKNGHVDMDAPIIWDFDQITDITARPIDKTTLTITGGRFTTIANKAESKYTYYSRGIAIRRSNVLVDGLEHRITGEGDHGTPYGGFPSINQEADYREKLSKNISYKREK